MIAKSPIICTYPLRYLLVEAWYVAMSDGYWILYYTASMEDRLPKLLESVIPLVKARWEAQQQENT